MNLIRSMASCLELAGREDFTLWQSQSLVHTSTLFQNNRWPMIWMARLNGFHLVKITDLTSVTQQSRASTSNICAFALTPAPRFLCTLRKKESELHRAPHLDTFWRSSIYCYCTSFCLVFHLPPAFSLILLNLHHLLELNMMRVSLGQHDSHKLGRKVT